MKYVCRGQCLVGECPFDRCVRGDSARRDREGLSSPDARIHDGEVALSSEDIRGDADLAVDVGTTTVVAGLYSRTTGAAAARTSALNAQRVFGPDVISRIERVREDPGGAEELHRLIVGQINDMTGELLERTNLEPGDVREAVLTGNTVMMHLLAGLSPASIGASPHRVSSLMGKVVRGSMLGLRCPERVYLPPSICAFVGSDVVCGMVDLGFSASSGSRMLVDIGTNGEIVLEREGEIAAASTAAGPAFEAVNISRGMPAFEGAIDGVSVVDGKTRCSTVGNAPARGICGSGLIDAVATFLRAGAIDETGAISRDARNYVEEDGAPALELADGVCLTQRDVREFQTAKAAIRAGIETLLDFFTMPLGELDVLYLCGGFGDHIARGSAVEVGLVPPARNIRRCGNTALSGAVRLFDESLRPEALVLAAKTKCLNLSTSAFFQERYVESMTFE